MAAAVTAQPGEDFPLTFPFPPPLPGATSESSTVTYTVQASSQALEDFTINGAPPMNGVTVSEPVPPNGLTVDLQIDPLPGIGDTFSITFTVSDTFTVAGVTIVNPPVTTELDFTIVSNSTGGPPADVVSQLNNLNQQISTLESQLSQEKLQLNSAMIGLEQEQITFREQGEQAWANASIALAQAINVATLINTTLDVGGALLGLVDAEQAGIHLVLEAGTIKVEIDNNEDQSVATQLNSLESNPAFAQALNTSVNAALNIGLEQAYLGTWTVLYTLGHFAQEIEHNTSELYTQNAAMAATIANETVFEQRIQTLQSLVSTTQGSINFLADPQQSLLLGQPTTSGTQPGPNLLIPLNADQVIAVASLGHASSTQVDTADGTGSASNPTTVDLNAPTFISLSFPGQSVLINPTAMGQLVIDGIDDGTGTSQQIVTFNENIGSYQIELSPNNQTIVEEASLNVLIENVSKVVFNDSTLSFNPQGFPSLVPNGPVSTGHAYDVSFGNSVITGFNQAPYYDPFQGDKLVFAGAVAPPTTGDFIVAPDVVTTYQDAVTLANELLQQYKYVVVTYDQGTSDLGSTSVQPSAGQDFMLLFVDTTGNHQADSIVRLVGLDSADQISLGDLVSASYTYTTLTDPLAGSGKNAGTAPLGISNMGKIVGSYQGTTSGLHGFLYDGSTYSTLSVPLAASGGTVAVGINSTGQIVGSYQDTANTYHGFLYNGSTYTSLNDPSAGSGGTEAFGINDAGQIIGFYADNSGTKHGFLYNGGTYITLNDPSAGSGGTEAIGINEAGQIVGFYTDSGGMNHGFLFNGSTYTTLDDPLGSGSTEAFGINAAGQIVGSYADSSGVEHAFLYSGGTYVTLGPLVLTTQVRLLDSIQIAVVLRRAFSEHLKAVFPVKPF
jgi:probable HAF family extracellular repeat protein